MRDLTIGKNEAGQRMDKYLKKYFPEAGSGFLYKMLRKKNILLNEKKADGKEMLKENLSKEEYEALFANGNVETKSKVLEWIKEWKR